MYSVLINLKSSSMKPLILRQNYGIQNHQTVPDYIQNSVMYAAEVFILFLRLINLKW
jgi:hypothetical protein